MRCDDDMMMDDDKQSMNTCAVGGIHVQGPNTCERADLADPTI